jgi:transcriptional regulator with XRE-family HTH domain
MTASMANRIRQARLDASLTQTQLADCLEINRSAVAQWERIEGGNQPSITNLIQIADVTEVGFEWLVTGRGIPGKNRRAKAPKVQTDYAADAFESDCLQLLRRVPSKRRSLVLQFLKAL